MKNVKIISLLRTCRVICLSSYNKLFIEEERKKKKRRREALHTVCETGSYQRKKERALGGHDCLTLTLFTHGPTELWCSEEKLRESFRMSLFLGCNTSK